MGRMEERKRERKRVDIARSRAEPSKVFYDKGEAIFYGHKMGGLQ